ncbi:MAG: CheR family methyltransferase, partial [Marinomonas sp.]
RGIRSVRQAGGFTCAQSPETAKFDPMPIAAIATEEVNAVGPPEQLARTVIEGLMMPMSSRLSSAKSDDDQAMAQIVDAVIGATTLKAEEYKHSTFARRVSRRMMNRRIDDLGEYSRIVAQDKNEAQALSDDLLIGVTEFFRDTGPFKTIKQVIVPQIIQKAHEEKRGIRIWIAGCATGEEAYTIAILFREALRDMPFEIDVQLFASDISRKHLDVAGRGAYTSEQVANIPRTLLERYFEFDDEIESWVVTKRVRKMIVFAPHDLLSDPPFTKLGLVCCRNVLIYFSVEAQQRILGGFAFGLIPGAFLFLGSSETIGGQGDVFEFVDGRQRIFRRTPDRVSLRSMSKARSLFPGAVTAPAAPLRKTTTIRSTELQPAYTALLSEFAPASLLFSSDRELLHSFGDAHRFLRPLAGAANLDVTEMVDASLKTPMIVALERASRDRKPLTFSKIALTSHPKEGLLVDLTVRPLRAEGDAPATNFLAIIDDHSSKVVGAAEFASVQAIDADQLMNSRQTELEEELARTREALQSTIEEIETANEELQASNEELMSANEELQSTNEELSSVNEELYTVNAEYHRQNDELTRLTSDFDLLLDATQIGVLFLDDEGKITRFTGLAKELFNFEESDVGRPAGTFKSPFEDFDIAECLQDIPKSGNVIEIERMDQDGLPWLIRVVSDDANFGVVMTFIDISELREAEVELRQTHRMLKIMRTTSHAFYFECDAKFETIFNQEGFDEFVGAEKMALPYALPYEKVHAEDLTKLRGWIADTAKAKSADFIFRMHSARRNEHRYIKMVADPLETGNWQVVAIDVDEIYRAELRQKEQSAILEATLLAGRAYNAYIRPDETFGFANQKFCTLFGMSKEEIVGKPIAEVFPAAFLKHSAEHIDAALAGHSRDDIGEVSIKNSKLLFSVRYRPVEEDGAIIGLVFDGLNISELSELADQSIELDRVMTSSIRNSAHPVMYVSPDNGRIRFANRASRPLLGLKGDQYYDNKFSISRITPEFTEKSWMGILDQTVKAGSSVLNDMAILIDGRLHDRADIYLEADMTRDDGGLVTARVFENSEKQQMIAGLRERSVMLASANRDLEQFTTAVAHDLRAPLRHINGFSEILALELDTLSQDEVKSNAQIVMQSAQSLRNMIAGLLVYTRIGQQVHDMGVCDLEKVCAAARLNLSEEIDASRAKISLDGSGQVTGNFDMLTSLFQNLIGNSIKYAAKGKAPEIAIEITEKSGGLMVAFEDNGIGIAPEFAEKIFELFRRLHSESDYAGLGIGLTTCKKIAELHKAELRLDTKYKEGSRFILGPLEAA